MSDDLLKLRQQITDLQQKAQELEVKEKSEAIKEVREKIELFHLTPADLGFGKSRSGSAAGSKVAPKYRKGSNIWTGRGRQPKWVAEHISQGGKLEDLLI